MASEDADPILYRGMSQAALDAAYNNGAAVANSAEIKARWREESAALRARLPQEGFRLRLDAPYAPGERRSVDLFLQPEPGAPTLVFIHGGYWRENDKEMFSFIAEGPLRAGYNVATLGYPLAPGARLDEIVAAARAGVAWVIEEVAPQEGHPERVAVSGWSAGGHLAACAMADPRVRRGLSISGLFDLEPMPLTYLNAQLRLTPEEARRNSPIHHLPAEAGALALRVGALELPELRRQSAEFHEAWAAAGLAGDHAEMAGEDHFTILDGLSRPDGALTEILKGWDWP